jgi:hypothetical protein
MGNKCCGAEGQEVNRYDTIIKNEVQNTNGNILDNEYMSV